MVNRISGKDPTYGVSLSFISVEATSKNKTSAAKFQITNLLRQRHNIVRDDDFAVRSQEDALNIVTNITSGLTFLLNHESDIESAFHLDVIASISLFCCSYINCCNFIFSSALTSDLPIAAIASLGDVTPCNTFPNVGLITEAAPNNSCPTVVSLNFFLLDIFNRFEVGILEWE